MATALAAGAKAQAAESKIVVVENVYFRSGWLKLATVLATASHRHSRVLHKWASNACPEEGPALPPPPPQTKPRNPGFGLC